MNASRALPMDRADEVVELIKDFEKLGNVGELMIALKPAAWKKMRISPH